MSEETIAQKMRRWAEEAKATNDLPTSVANKERIDYFGSIDDDCDLFIYIADQIEAEQKAIRNENSSKALRSYAAEIRKPLRDDETVVDWLNRWYIPRPVFDDGEPCNVGDEVEFPQPAAVKKVLSFIAGEDGITSANVGLSSGPVAIYAGKVKRPKPKLLDADGIEIKVGDTVWVKNSPFEPLLVSGFKDGRVLMSYHNETSLGYKPTSLTHSEPDSLEKLLAELRGVDFIPSKEYLNHIADRLTAIMERDA